MLYRNQPYGGKGDGIRSASYNGRPEEIVPLEGKQGGIPAQGKIFASTLLLSCTPQMANRTSSGSSLPCNSYLRQDTLSLP